MSASLTPVPPVPSRPEKLHRVIQMSTDIVFEESRIEYLLDLFDKDVDDEGYIIEADTQKRVTSSDGNEIKPADIGVVGHGSEIFVEDDFTSIVDYVSKKEGRRE